MQALQQPLLPVLLPALPGSSSSGLGVTTQAAWVERSPLLVSLCFSVRASSSLLSSQPDRWRGRPSLVCNVCLFSPSLLSLQTLCTLQGPEVRARQRPTGQPWLQELTPDPTLLLKRFWMLMAFCVLLGNGVGGGRGSEPAVRTPLFGGMVATPLSGETSLWGEPLPLCWGTCAGGRSLPSQVCVVTALSLLAPLDLAAPLGPGSHLRPKPHLFPRCVVKHLLFSPVSRAYS